MKKNNGRKFKALSSNVFRNGKCFYILVLIIASQQSNSAVQELGQQIPIFNAVIRPGKAVAVRILAGQSEKITRFIVCRGVS